MQKLALNPAPTATGSRRPGFARRARASGLTDNDAAEGKTEAPRYVFDVQGWDTAPGPGALLREER
jgi:hypothetical protein